MTPPEGENASPTASHTSRLLRLALRHRGATALAMVAMVISGITDATPILLAKVFVDQVLVGTTPADATAGWLDSLFRDFGVLASNLPLCADLDPRLHIAVAVAVVMLLAGMLGAVAAYANEFMAKYLAALVVRDLKVKLMARVVQLPVSWFSQNRLGDLVSRFSNDTQTAYGTITVFLGELLMQPMVILGGAVAAAAINWQLFVASLIFVPAIVVPVRRLGKRAQRKSHSTLSSLADTMQSVNQVLTGVRVVKAFRMEQREVDEYREVNQEWLRRQMSLARTLALSRGITDLVNGALLAVILFAGSYLVVTERFGLTAGGFTAFLLALISFYRPVKRLAAAFSTWKTSLAAAARVFDVIDLPIEIQDVANAVTIGPVRHEVRFNEVEFTYPDADGKAQPVLRKVSFTLAAGEKVALVGPSGAGKSTIADLILRFHEPIAGSISIDGHKLQDIARGSLLAQVAVVSQQPFLFNSSIRDNIAYGSPTASESHIERAAKAACIHDEIMAMPLGYATQVGERGARLSGGQLQRITIARAILKDASLLVLDEATSSLDTRSERLVQDALANLLRGRTALVIAHRLSTIVSADRILVLDGGCIVQEGTHTELMARAGLYRDLHAV
ncbi:MAG: ABC transporter ATP-binding protein [Planctomycetes bacterium]|nr:ABC transporter ATP-binding protein [Planctomycetota bacterium]